MNKEKYKKHKIRDISSALEFIEQDPQKVFGYNDLSYHYSVSKHLQTPKDSTTNHIASSLGPYHFIYSKKNNLEYKLTILYEKENEPTKTIFIQNLDFYGAIETVYTKENNAPVFAEHLHSFQSFDPKYFETDFQHIFDCRN